MCGSGAGARIRRHVFLQGKYNATLVLRKLFCCAQKTQVLLEIETLVPMEETLLSMVNCSSMDHIFSPEIFSNVTLVTLGGGSRKSSRGVDIWFIDKMARYFFHPSP